MDPRMDLITEPRQILVVGLNAAICGLVNDCNSFWGIAPNSRFRSQYTNWINISSSANAGTTFKARLRGEYEMHFFCSLFNESEVQAISARVGLALDASVAEQQTDPSNVTVGIFGLDACSIPGVVGGLGDALSVTGSIQINDVRVGNPALGVMHVLLSNGAGGTPSGMQAASALLTITRMSDIMGSWV